jgi:hypothetical protein
MGWDGIGVQSDRTLIVLRSYSDPIRDSKFEMVHEELPRRERP